jgi:adenylate cyclase
VSEIWSRIRKRKIVQWSLAYLAAAWALLGAVDLLGAPFDLPPSLMVSLFVLAGAGLIATIIVAWYHGEKGAQRVTAIELLMLAALLTTAGGVLWLIGANRAPTAAPGRSDRIASLDSGTIAVMPCEALGSVEPGDRLTDLIQDEIIRHLAQIPGVSPISRNSAKALSEGGLTVPEIADSVNVRYVLDCSVVRDASRVRINAQLIDAPIDRYLWTDEHDFQVMDVFGLQEDVAVWITERLLSGVRSVLPILDHTKPTNAQAYERYLDGKYLVNSRRREDMARAIDAYREALEMDPGLAPADAALALAYALWGHYGYGGSYATYETFGEALRLADRAVELDPDLAEAYSALAYLLSKALAPADTVETAFRRALKLAPASAEAHTLYAGFLAREGRYEQSLSESQEAIRLDPVAPGRDSGFGYNALAAGQPAVALRAAERANVLEPALMAPRLIRGLSLVLLERPDECLDIDLGEYAAVRAVCLHAAGREDAARVLMDSVEAHPGPRPAALHIASYYAWTGNVTKALAALKNAYETSPNGLDYRVVASGIFDSVRQDPRFQAGIDAIRRDVWNRVSRSRRRAGS